MAGRSAGSEPIGWQCSKNKWKCHEIKLNAINNKTHREKIAEDLRHRQDQICGISKQLPGDLQRHFAILSERTVLAAISIDLVLGTVVIVRCLPYLLYRHGFLTLLTLFQGPVEDQIGGFQVVRFEFSLGPVDVIAEGVLQWEWGWR